jgi:heme exporter protein A
MTPGAAVEARALTRRFGPTLAVDGVDLDLEPGSFLTIFGPNGAGKTTLLRLLCGLIKPTSGSVAVLGSSPREDPAGVKRRVGLIGHSSFLYGGLTARENLAFYASLYAVRDAAARIRELLGELGLSARADDPVRAYSRGMVQRLTIARALLHDPEVVFLDEPFTGLDQQASRRLRGLLAAIRGRGRTALMVTHNLEEGLELSTRVAIMAGGRIVEAADAAGLTRPALEALYAEKADAWAS